MNPLSQRALEWVWSQSLQVLPPALALALVWRLSRRTSAHWRYLLGLLVLAKCLVPAFVALPVPGRVVPLIQGAVGVAVVQANGEQATAAPPAGSQAVQAVAPHTGLSPGTLCALVWFVGAAAMVGLGALKALRIQARLRRTRVEPDLELECEFLELCRRLGLRNRPKLCLLASAGQPFVWGIWRGCIYLPAAFPGVGHARERQVVLAHELAHVLRWDVLVNFVQVLVQAVFWFHPAVWWLNARLRHEREKCCDEMAIAALRVDAAAYGSVLVDHLVAQFSPAMPPSSLAISGQAKELEDRLTTILAPKRSFRLWPSAAAVLGVLIAAVVVLPVGVGAHRSALVAAEIGAHPRALVLGTAANRDSSGQPFEELPAGEQQFGGVYWVIKGVTPVPASSSILASVGIAFHRIHLLHALDGTAGQGATVGHVRFHYRDGSTAELAIRYGEHLQDCRFAAFSPVRDPGSAMAWTGGNPETRAAGLALRLYRTTFVNPRPAMPVESVEYSARATGPAPLLAAVTID